MSVLSTAARGRSAGTHAGAVPLVPAGRHRPLRRRPTRLVGLALAASVLLAPVALAGPASAHDSLTSSSPADGATVTSPPARVTLSFTDQVKQIGLTVLVTDPAGASVADGKPTIDGNAVVQRLDPLTASGAYTVAYRVVSSDGHPIEGRLTFTADLPSPSPTATPSDTATPSATATPAESVSASASPAESVIAASPAASTSDGSGSGTGWIVAGVGLLAVVVVVGLVLARRRSA